MRNKSVRTRKPETRYCTYQRSSRTMPWRLHPVVGVAAKICPPRFNPCPRAPASRATAHVRRHVLGSAPASLQGALMPMAPQWPSEPREWYALVAIESKVGGDRDVTDSLLRRRERLRAGSCTIPSCCRDSGAGGRIVANREDHRRRPRTLGGVRAQNGDRGVCRNEPTARQMQHDDQLRGDPRPGCHA